MDVYPRTPLTQVVVAHMREDINKRNLQPGDRLPTERKLMEEFQVGRSTVREAMKILAALGVVEIRRGDGAYVAHPEGAWSFGGSSLGVAVQRTALRDIVELRRAIEPMAAFLAAERSTPEDVLELESILQEHEAQLARDPAWHWEPLAFEMAIADVTGNTLLVQIQGQLKGMWSGLSSEFRESVARTVEWMHEHWVIYDAIRTGNPTRAREATLLHLDIERFESDMRGRHAES